MGLLPITLILDSDPKIVYRYTPGDFSAFQDKLRGTIAGFLLKVGLKGEFRAHLFHDHFAYKGSNGHQKIWLESQNVNSMVFAVKPDGDKVCLVRLWLPKVDGSDAKELRSAISTALETKEPPADPPAPPPPRPPVPPPPKPSADRQPPGEKKAPKGKFSLKSWLAESSNLILVLLTLHAFLEKKNPRRVSGKVMVGLLRNSGVLPETGSPKSFNRTGLLLESMGYLEKVKSGLETFFRLTPRAEELVQKHPASGKPTPSPKPASPSEAVLGRMHDPKAAEMFEQIAAQMAELTKTYERLARHLGGKAS